MSAPYPFNPPLTAYDYNNIRDRVFAFEAKMLEQPNQLDLEVKHYFSYGIYGRELFIPAGTILTGKIHKTEQLNILLKGEISVLVDDEIKRIKAPFIVVSPAGTKRIAYAHEDCIWLTVHGTHERNLDKIERQFIAQNEQEWLDYCKKLDNQAHKEICGQTNLLDIIK